MKITLSERVPFQSRFLAFPFASKHRASIKSLFMVMLVACLSLIVGCNPDTSQSNGGNTTSPTDSTQKSEPADTHDLPEEVQHCNHPYFADTVVTFACTEALGCGATAPATAMRNAVKFRLRSNCNGGANYVFHGNPLLYSVYKHIGTNGNNYHFSLMKKFTCLSNPMVIASDQFLDNRLYLVNFFEDLNTPIPMDLSVPVGSNFSGWVFRAGKYKGRPCKAE